MPFPDDVNPTVPTRIDRLRLAFAVRIAQRIAAADGVVVPGEVALLTRCFPAGLLYRAGMVDRNEALTPGVEAVFRDALRELPTALTVGEKLDLVTLFHRTAAVDGGMHPEELRVLEEGAAMLEVPRKLLTEHLRVLGERLTLVQR